jgi:hypothetical protein
MELIVLVKRQHTKYANDWTPPDYERLRSITTEQHLWERLGKAKRDGEEVVVYDPERRLALRSKVKSTAAFPGHWQVVFDSDQQKTCSLPTLDFPQGLIAAEVQDRVIVRHYWPHA